MKELYFSYVERLNRVLRGVDTNAITHFADAIMRLLESRQRLFICGNGGSAANAMHLANDFLYGIHPGGMALDVEALSANPSVLTCLGNDIGYENIFTHQLKVKAKPGDALLVLSGSGNSPNIVNALEFANSIAIDTFAILGYSGGKAKKLANTAIHFEIDDMQVSEDTQLVIGHVLMQHLNQLLEAN